MQRVLAIEQDSKSVENATWYQQFEEKYVNQDLHKYSVGMIDDSDVQETFLKHARSIIDHHQQKGLSAGNTTDYIEAFVILNGYFTKLRKTRLGYFSLVGIAATYIGNYLIGKGIILEGELGRAFRLACQKNDAEVNGKKPLFQVKCDAERDFVLLIRKYFMFFVLSRQCEGRFNQKTINAGLKLPNLSKVLNQKLKEYDNRVRLYESSKNKSQTQYETAQKNHHVLRETKRNVSVQEVKTVEKNLPIQERDQLSLYKKLGIIPVDLQQIEHYLEEERKLTEKKRLAYNLINRYLLGLSMFNLYGRKRAEELRADIIACKDMTKLNHRIWGFITTGKTESDYHWYNFFRSPSLKSGLGPDSLRGMFIQEQGRFNLVI